MAYIDDIGNHYNDDTSELIQVSSKLRYFSVPSTVRTTKEFAFIRSRLDVLIFRSPLVSVEGLYGLRVTEIYVPLGLTDHFVNLFKTERVREHIKEIDFEKVDLYYRIGLSLLEGDEVSKDIPKALEYLDYCAKNLDVRAIYLLAQYYEERHEYIKAYNRYLKASYFLYKDAAYRAESLDSLAEQEQKRKEEQQCKECEEQQRKAEEERLRQEKMRKRAYYLFFDTETTGLPKSNMAPVTDTESWPRMIQLAWILTDKEGNVINKQSALIRPERFTIPADATAVHGITTERALRDGRPLWEVLDEFMQDFKCVQCFYIVGHNIDFDRNVLGCELYRMNRCYQEFMVASKICTMKRSTKFCAIQNPNSYYGDYKWPKLQELYHKLFGYNFDSAHDALADITATKDCFFELKRRGIIKD